MQQKTNEDFGELAKRLTIIALFRDDDLMERFVLKGGNALDIIHDLLGRASIDIDISMSRDIEENEFDSVRERILDNLQRTFRERNFEVFDFRFVKRPSISPVTHPHFWGGYEAEFKFIQSNMFAEFKSDMAALRRNACTIGQTQHRILTIDISKFEACYRRESANLEGYTIYVYSPELIVVEKLRAICQQMPEYLHGKKAKRERAKDFFDIKLVMEKFPVDFAVAEIRDLVTAVFASKDVPLTLIGKIPGTFSFHEVGFATVRDTVKRGVSLNSFEYYFECVRRIVSDLKPLWDK